MSLFSSAQYPTLPLAEKNQDENRAGSQVNELPDETLFIRLQEGEQEALGCLFERYARLVRSIASRILRNTTEAEDLVQDLFLFIQRKCAVFDSSKSSAGSWIVQMTYQRAIERRRRLATRHFYKHKDLQSSGAGVVGIATTENDYSPEAVFGRNGLKRILSALSEDQRETLRLYFFEGYTLAEISLKLDQPLGNVRHHYYRALERLRRGMFGRKVQGD
jgi:RNA polymerase sigma-70 factor (ECF subfamily)